MQVQVQLSNLRIAPLKVRRVADMIRGKKAQQARDILSFTLARPVQPVLKLLNSAMASAKNDLKLDENNLFVSKITVDEGPKLKRSHPMSRGRAYPIMKRSSHIVLTLSELVPTVKTETKKEEVKAEKPVVKTKKPAAIKPKATKKK